ncbi:FKBP-type peptidyl-prolyl cis-trans isomerase [Moheibacter lacus]|uniref:Peptidyl-prolyl cis-trans isomerase n=1 Tax=Moheibacter lacus TaxID=2745851 RepID=A0A838ZL78_9FLAO|nr:FKBP-type peptidyl-prolyl cis-trans isomerase [Moheibacter lacus]MBA5628480.1 FKBP-type peptidyl-prolyl cis-trans isomerase [Moheibacter lacus]
MKKIALICAILSLAACKNKVVQYPVSYDDDRAKFMEFSHDRNKQILDEDNALIQNYIDRSDLKFQRTSYGFWISNSGETTQTMAKSGDVVKYAYSVSNFDDEIIYSEAETGTQTIMMGRSDLPRGIQFALQMIEKGDAATVLLPSFLAYGGYGDRNKILGNEPLIFKIKIQEIQKKSN